MRGPLVIAAAQPSCVPHDVAANAVTHAAAVRRARARVVVFPELSLTGYELDTAPVAAADPGLSPLVEACAEMAAVALVGAPVEAEAGRRHIAMLAVDGRGSTVVYRKMWLGGAEPERYSPGAHPAAYDVDGWRLGLAICKDTGVARHAADTAALGIDVYVAGVLESAKDSDVQPERARRIVRDHRLPVVVASFAGSTGGGFSSAAGGSAIWGPDGDVLAHAGPEPDDIARAVLGP